jgi:hypothetical protein
MGLAVILPWAWSKETVSPGMGDKEPACSSAW